MPKDDGLLTAVNTSLTMAAHESNSDARVWVSGEWDMVMAECLLIDRNEIERARFREQLTLLGLKIVEREDADQGLVYCNDNQPDVVLMALQGASLKTAEFIGRMHRNREGRRPVVIAYGSQSHASRIGQTILDGAAEVLLLPVDSDIIGFKLKQAGVL